MLSMQSFFETLQREHQDDDAHWKALAQIAKARLDQIQQMDGSLGWYFWWGEPEG